MVRCRSKHDFCHRSYWLQLSAAREERDIEVKAMAQRMEAAISSCAKR